jgi:retron-type reverse transcriptase
LGNTSIGNASDPNTLEGAPDNTAARELRDLARQTIDEHFRGLWAHTWGRWLVSSAGTPAWKRVRELALERTRLLDDTLSLLEDGRKALNPPGLRLAVAQALHDPRQVPREPVQALQRWLQLDPAATTVLAEHGPVSLLLDLAASPKTPQSVLLALVQHGPAATQAGSVRMAAWRAQLRRVGSVDRLTELVLHPPERGAWVWSAHWPLLSDRTSAGTADSTSQGDERDTDESRTLPRALVLAARRSGWRLIELEARLGSSVFSQALTDARALLEPAAPREAATLELIAALGVKVAPHVMRALTMARRGAPPGQKLDRAYQRHLLPKKSGGSRVISAPEAALKRVQRAVLERLLQPLGQHEAAHGFVPGHSIVGNAQVHVGQSVVVNADVRACFPSVKWPLVLAALRRDLGVAASSDEGPGLSPVAISLLCDLCTAEGGLPIGAPTSPALLNRVLLKTDEILTAAATARGVRYTRYADDLSFSGGDAAVQMLGIARRTLGQIGLELDPRKTNIFRRGRRQVVTGLVVNDQVAVPRRIRRRLRAAVHQVEQGKAAHWHGQQQGLDALQGRLAFVRMVHADEGAALMKRLRAARSGVEELELAGESDAPTALTGLSDPNPAQEAV